MTDTTLDLPGPGGTRLAPDAPAPVRATQADRASVSPGELEPADDLAAPATSWVASNRTLIYRITVGVFVVLLALGAYGIFSGSYAPPEPDRPTVPNFAAAPGAPARAPAGLPPAAQAPTPAQSPMAALQPQSATPPGTMPAATPPRPMSSAAAPGQPAFAPPTGRDSSAPGGAAFPADQPTPNLEVAQLRDQLQHEITALGAAFAQMHESQLLLDRRLVEIESHTTPGKPAAPQHVATAPPAEPRAAPKSAPLPIARAAPAPVTPTAGAAPSPITATQWELRVVSNDSASALIADRAGHYPMRSVHAGDEVPGIGRVIDIGNLNGRWTVIGSAGRITQ